jgi:hypothetical protein
LYTNFTSHRKELRYLTVYPAPVEFIRVLDACYLVGSLSFSLMCCNLLKCTATLKCWPWQALCNTTRTTHTSTKTGTELAVTLQASSTQFQHSSLGGTHIQGCAKSDCGSKGAQSLIVGIVNVICVSARSCVCMREWKHISIIIMPGTRGRLVVSITPLPLYTQGNSSKTYC